MKMTFTPGPGVRVISHSEGVVINQPSAPATVTTADDGYLAHLFEMCPQLQGCPQEVIEFVGYLAA